MLSKEPRRYKQNLAQKPFTLTTVWTWEGFCRHCSAPKLYGRHYTATVITPQVV